MPQVVQFKLPADSKRNITIYLSDHAFTGKILEYKDVTYAPTIQRRLEQAPLSENTRRPFYENLMTAIANAMPNPTFDTYYVHRIKRSPTTLLLIALNKDLTIIPRTLKQINLPKNKSTAIKIDNTEFAVSEAKISQLEPVFEQALAKAFPETLQAINDTLTTEFKKNLQKYNKVLRTNFENALKELKYAIPVTQAESKKEINDLAFPHQSMPLPTANPVSVATAVKKPNALQLFFRAFIQSIINFFVAIKKAFIRKPTVAPISSTIITNPIFIPGTQYHAPVSPASNPHPPIDSISLWKGTRDTQKSGFNSTWNFLSSHRQEETIESATTPNQLKPNVKP